MCAPWETGHYYAATEYFTQAAKLRSNSAGIAFLLAESYRNSRDYAHAQEWYEKTTKLDGDNAKAFYYWGLMLKMNGQCEKAKEEFAKFKNLKRIYIFRRRT